MPSSRLISVAQVAWKAATTSRCSSGSRWVERALEPTMSQNMTVSWRRSGEDAAKVGGRGPGFRSSGLFTARFAPHSAQNLAPDGLAWPQLAQVRGNGVPHSGQNFAPFGATALQLPHSTQAPKAFEQ